tara:strand:- start:485 stop:754 length:270 start_codon:yes stop_codon:yes gene_type:complete
MAFKKWQKAPVRTLPKKTWETEEMKVIGWCMNNNIKVSISPDWKDEFKRWQIEININGKNHTDPKRYDDDVVYEKFNEYYKYYYDKYNK